MCRSESTLKLICLRTAWRPDNVQPPKRATMRRKSRTRHLVDPTEPMSSISQNYCVPPCRVVTRWNLSSRLSAAACISARQRCSTKKLTRVVKSHHFQQCILRTDFYKLCILYVKSKRREKKWISANFMRYVTYVKLDVNLQVIFLPFSCYRWGLEDRCLAIRLTRLVARIFSKNNVG